ncbi:hypothetical protein BDS110ZK12_86170 [Bradyrhizobium diazoefficiens]
MAQIGACWPARIGHGRRGGFRVDRAERSSGVRQERGPVEITIGKVSVRLDADVSAVRIAEIVTAIERGA